jgi:hypothetical protein
MRANLILALPPRGKGPRSFQCFECDRPDPLETDAVKWIEGELRPPVGIVHETLKQKFVVHLGCIGAYYHARLENYWVRSFLLRHPDSFLGML